MSGRALETCCVARHSLMIWLLYLSLKPVHPWIIARTPRCFFWTPHNLLSSGHWKVPGAGPPCWRMRPPKSLPHQEPDLHAEGWGHQSLLLTVNMCRHDISSPLLAFLVSSPQTSRHHMWLLLSILQRRVACFQMEVVWLNPRCERLLLSQHQMLPFQGGKGGPQTHFSPTELPVSGCFC